MAEIKTNINHVKTYLNDLESECDNLIDNKVKSSAPKARAIAQKIKLIMNDLRKDIQKNAVEVPVKSRIKKVVPAVEATTEPVADVEVAVKAAEVLLPEPTVEIPKKKTARKTPVSKKSK